MISDPNADYESPPHIKKLLAILEDAAYQHAVEQAETELTNLDRARERHKRWSDVGDGGTPQGLDLQETRLADIEDEIRGLHARRGDFGEESISGAEAAEPLSPTGVGMSQPTALTTNDIAHSFAGLRWPSEAAWKKPLGDKPKWLAACVVIPGSRGLNETRWNPVLIGAALIGDGHVKVNSVRARFQTMPSLQPWLEVWKTYEADNFDSP